VVSKQEKLVVTKLMNFPNPFTTSTHFSFEHNQPNTDLGVEIGIYTLSGKLLKTIHRTVHTGGTRNIQIEWDGRDETGRKLKKATYIYHIKVSLNNNFYQEAKQILVF
jgi:flagellar hook assembly protein FlgD